MLWLIDCNLLDEIIFKQVVGYGGQAEVWKVFYNGKLVAAKSFYFSDNTSDLTKFMQEVKILRYSNTWWDTSYLCSSLQHPNIIQFFGVVITSNSKMWLITELMDIKLTDVLAVITDKNKLDIAMAVAKAM